MIVLNVLQELVSQVDIRVVNEYQVDSCFTKDILNERQVELSFFNVRVLLGFRSDVKQLGDTVGVEISKFSFSQQVESCLHARVDVEALLNLRSFVDVRQVEFTFQEYFLNYLHVQIGEAHLGPDKLWRVLVSCC